MLELMTGKKYNDVVTRATIPNAVMLYQKLSTLSIREMPKYNIKIHIHDEIKVEVPRPTHSSIRKLKSNPLSIEQLLTAARMPEIIRCIEGQTMIYTEYVTGVIKQLSSAVKNAGYTYALYTGSVRELNKFLNKKVQVLIASRPISVGVDRLQEVCNRLIINTLPWTNAQYQQLIGRLYRIGQAKDVDIYVIKASIGGYPYDELIKWKRIQFKRTLADCAVDGILPVRNLVTPRQAAAAAVEWLERLERGEISRVTRRDVDIELTPMEIERRIINYGDFSQQNQKINTELSETTHKRFQENPEAYFEYHRQLRIQRIPWSVDPLIEIIARLKTMSSKLRIGDFGCGLDAKLMDELGTDRVIGFDHVATSDSKVIAIDMKDVSQYVDNASLEVVVFCLSLMGKNWRAYIVEAKRCLCVRGSMLIAQTTRELENGQRLSGLREFINKQGFVIDLDETRGDFTFIEATKL